MSPELYQRIGDALASLAPHGWQTVTLTYSAVGRAASGGVEVTARDGSPLHGLGPVPRDVAQVMADVREASYVSDAGTWFTATAVLHAAGRLDVSFDYDDEPSADFPVTSYEQDLIRFPRSEENMPMWLLEKLGSAPAWIGARWQLEFRAPGAASPAVVDATTTDDGHRWAHHVARRLSDEAVAVELGFDEGEDEHGDPARYVQLDVSVGEGYMSLSFFRDIVFWSVDVFADQCDHETSVRAARSARRVVTEVTGWSLDPDGLRTYERRLLGL
jgi:hypothetical protein